jgi:hypothetical protein
VQRSFFYIYLPFAGPVEASANQNRAMIGAIFFVSVAVVGGVFGLGRIYRMRRQARFIHKLLSVSPSLAQRPRTIVSLTTLPDRIVNLRPTLQCLLAQTLLPDEIIIAVPDVSVRQGRPYTIPTFIEQTERVRILRCARDWGPATKFIPVIQEELAEGRGETLIVVVDDDRLYPCDTIATYVHYSAQLPEAALCFRGAPMPRNFDWRHSEMIRGQWLRKPRRIAVITGCGSYLLKPKFFDESLQNYAVAPRSAFYMDDIWISGCLDRRGIKKYVVPSSKGHFSVQQQSRTMTLHDVPNGRQANNNEMIAFFRSSWDVFAS